MRFAVIAAVLLSCACGVGISVSTSFQFRSSFSAQPIILHSGAAVDVPIAVTRTRGYVGNVRFSISDLPRGVVVTYPYGAIVQFESFDQSMSGNLVVRFTSSVDAVRGVTHVTLTGDDGFEESSESVAIQVE